MANLGEAFSLLLSMGANEADQKWAKVMDELFIYLPERDSYRPRYQEVGRETIRQILKGDR